MSSTLCTFPGKYGDILWSLPTVREISKLVGEKVDFCCMEQYKSLYPLLRAQPYINDVFELPEWIFWHSNYGDQPWNPQPPAQARIDAKYAKHFHLGYRSHPGKTFGNVEMQLMDFIAMQAGVRISDPLHFLYAAPLVLGPPHTIAYGFNDQYATLKASFLDAFREHMRGYNLIDVTKLPWLDAALAIERSQCFVGCRSASWVLANGLDKPMFIYEPHPARNFQGHLGTVFGCSYTTKKAEAPINMPPAVAADYAAKTIQTWYKETEDAITQTVTR